MKKISQRDIAKTLGVNVSSVSRALKGQKGVSEEMREKIIRLADEMGYRQPSARDEAKGKNIGILLHEKHFSKYNSFYLNMYQLLATELSSHGNFGLLEIASYDLEKKLLLPGFIKEGKVDALILQGEFSKEYCGFIKKRVGPFGPLRPRR